MMGLGDSVTTRIANSDKLNLHGRQTSCLHCSHIRVLGQVAQHIVVGAPRFEPRTPCVPMSRDHSRGGGYSTLPLGDPSWFVRFLLDLNIEEPVVRVAVLVVEDILFQLPGHGHFQGQPQRLTTFSEGHL